MSTSDVIIGGSIATGANLTLFVAGEYLRRRVDARDAKVALGLTAVRAIEAMRSAQQHHHRIVNLPGSAQEAIATSTRRLLDEALAAWEGLLAAGSPSLIRRGSELMGAVERLFDQATSGKLPADRFSLLTADVQSARAKLLAGRSRRRLRAIRKAFAPPE